MITRCTVRLAGAVFAAALAMAAARADVSQSVNAAANATVRPAGIRSGTSGVRYFNVEGSSNGSNASYGVLRFDTAPLKAAFDTQFGAGAYSLTDISLALTESNAAFTHPGSVAFAYSPDNTTDITAANTTLKYDAADPLPSHQFAQTFIANGLFNTTGNVGTGTVDTYSLLADNAGGAALADAIRSGNIVTLIVNDGDPAVAATWAGAANTTLAPPALIVKAAAAVPEPGSLALVLTAVPAIIGIRRRRI